MVCIKYGLIGVRQDGLQLQPFAVTYQPPSKNKNQYKYLITNLLSFTKQLGYVLRTLNTSSQELENLDYRESIYVTAFYYRKG